MNSYRNRMACKHLVSFPKIIHGSRLFSNRDTDEHGELVNPLLNIDNAAAQLLERADKCMKRFGEAIVLYDL